MVAAEIQSERKRSHPFAIATAAEHTIAAVQFAPKGHAADTLSHID